MKSGPGSLYLSVSIAALCLWLALAGRPPRPLPTPQDYFGEGRSPARAGPLPLSRYADFALAARGFLEVLQRARRALAAIAGDAQFAAQVLERAYASLSGVTNLTVGDGTADADEHENSP